MAHLDIGVSRLVLGCGSFGGIGSAPAFHGRGETEAQAFELMDRAWAAGIRTFYTALNAGSACHSASAAVASSPLGRAIFLAHAAKSFRQTKSIADRTLPRLDDAGFFHATHAEANSAALLVKHPLAGRPRRSSP